MALSFLVLGIFSVPGLRRALSCIVVVARLTVVRLLLFGLVVALLIVARLAFVVRLVVVVGVVRFLAIVAVFFGIVGIVCVSVVTGREKSCQLLLRIPPAMVSIVAPSPGTWPVPTLSKSPVCGFDRPEVQRLARGESSLIRQLNGAGVVNTISPG